MSPEKVIVPEEASPVKPEAAPALFTTRVGELIRLVNVPVKLIPLVTAPALWVKFKRLVTVPAPVCWIKVLLVKVPVGLLVVNVATVAAALVADKVSLSVKGERLPTILCQKLLAAEEHEDQVGVVPPTKQSVLFAPAAV